MSVTVSSNAASGFASRKRKRSSSSECREMDSLGKRSWYYVLESDSSDASEGTESVYSVQEKSTEYVRDTSDTSSKSSWDEDDASQMVEFEVVSLSEGEQVHPFPSDSDSSSAPEDVNRIKVINWSFGTGSDIFADTSSLDSNDDQCDIELGPADFWTCVRCKEENNNPLFRYCEKCYKVRKNFFPPRPKRKKNKKSSNLSSSSQDIGIGSSSSYEFPIGSSSSQELPSHSSQELLGSKREEELCLGSSPLPRNPEDNKSSDLCETCLSRVKDGGYLHGSIIHVYSCYKCSLRTLKQIGRCPVCNVKVKQVVRVINF